MNVLHWHIVDSYSFPLQLDSYPQLSQAGSWDPTAVYTRQQIQFLVEYARQRGVRVIPEIDIPGHAYSWGLAFPQLTVSCPSTLTADIGPINVVPLDPTQEFTYTVVEAVINEVTQLFPDAYIHVGGDELQLECWNSSQAIQDYIQSHNISSVSALQAMFESRLMAIVAKTNRTAIVWDETYFEVCSFSFLSFGPVVGLFSFGIREQVGSTLNPSTVVEVWTNVSVVPQILAAGHSVILADGEWFVWLFRLLICHFVGC